MKEWITSWHALFDHFYYKNKRTFIKRNTQISNFYFKALSKGCVNVQLYKCNVSPDFEWPDLGDCVHQMPPFNARISDCASKMMKK